MEKYKNLESLLKELEELRKKTIEREEEEKRMKEEKELENNMNKEIEKLNKFLDNEADISPPNYRSLL
jgi:hypothetical protein